MQKLVKTFLFLVFFAIIICLSNTIYAANLNVNVNCDGKKIEMTSETPEMTWTIENLLPGESDETILTFHNTGKNFVNISFIPKIENGKDVADILNVKVIKLTSETVKKEEEFYNGKYSGLVNMGLGLESGKSQAYKIVTSLPIEIGNEFQNKECVVKFHIKASGTEDKTNLIPDLEPPKQEIPEPEPPKQEIIEKEPSKQLETDVIKPVQTGESRSIYIIVGVLVVAVVVLVGTFWFVRKKNK